MPVYEYECRSHGVFEAFKPLAEYTSPADCPDCATPAGRILSVPHLASVPRATRIAHERNERSRHEPRMAHGCSDPHHPKHAAPKPVGERPALRAYTGKRPWVIEHG